LETTELIPESDNETELVSHLSEAKISSRHSIEWNDIKKESAQFYELFPHLKETEDNL
jgi:hypothetical protein